MKWFFSVVVVLNVLLAGWIALQKTPEANFEAREVSPQLVALLPEGKPLVEASAPAVLSVMTASAPQAEAPPALVGTASMPAAALPAKAVALAVPPLASGDTPAKQCLRWGALDARQLARVEGELAGLRLTPAQLKRQMQPGVAAGGKTWVYYPPLATRAETQTLIAELKAKGFDSYIVRSEGPFRGHLSLGLFGKIAGAQALQARLKAAGFPDAKIDARAQGSEVTTLRFTALAPWQVDKLRALQRRMLPGISLNHEPCP